jgi:predicted transcriptional regulator
MRLFRLNRGRGTILGPLEDRVMQVIWSCKDPMTVSDVQHALQRKRRDLAYSTVKAILTNLAQKGYLNKRAEGRTNVFAAAISQADFKERVVTEVLNALAKDYRNPLLATLVDRLATDPSTLDDLEKLIARRRAEAGGHG